MNTTLLARLGAAFISCTAAAQSPFFNSTPIPIPTSGQANPYPSIIEVWGIKGNVGRVTVTLYGLGHTNPDDLDIVVVSPRGEPCILLSDCGGTADATNLTLTFDDTGPLAPDAAALAQGTYHPTNITGGDAWPAPGPGSAANTNLSAFTGSNQNGDWKLFVFDDAAGGSGSIAGGWSVTITEAPPSPATFTSFAGFDVPLQGPALSYQATITVNGLAGMLDTLTVTLTLAHGSPDDLDILLAGPDGQRVMLMSDCGGTTSTGANITLTLSDAAASPLPNSTALVTGTFRPANYAGTDGIDVLPAPAPSLPYSSMLAAFANSNPNGAWSLYVNDDQANFFGRIEVWSLQFTQRLFCRADYDRDAQVTPADVARFVSDWFADVSAGCP